MMQISEPIDAPKKNRERLLSYFNNLDKEFHSPETFQQNWNNIELQGFTATELCDILEKIGNFVSEHEPPLNKSLQSNLKRFMRNCFISWREPALTVFPDFGEENCATIWSAMGKLELWSDAAFLHTLQDNTISRLNSGSFTGKHCAKIWRGFSKMALEPDPAFFDALRNQTIKCIGSDDFSDLDCASVWVALARLAIEPDEEFFCILDGKTIEYANSDEASKGFLCGTGWSLAIFHALSDGKIQAYKNLYQDILNSMREKRLSLDEKEAHQLEMAALTFGADLNLSFRDSVESRIETRLTELFTKAGYEQSPDVKYIPILARNVDIGMRIGRDRTPLRIEVDGIGHYIKKRDPNGKLENSRYNGSTCLQTFLLKRFYPKGVIARISTQVARSMLEHSEQGTINFVHKFVEAASKRHGAFVVSKPAEGARAAALTWTPL